MSEKLVETLPGDKEREDTVATGVVNVTSLSSTIIPGYVLPAFLLATEWEI